MDRLCPSYDAGFDVCDPFGPVLDKRSVSGSAARVLRRRCRSEGIERSPYEEIPRNLEQVARPASHKKYVNTRPNSGECHRDFYTKKITEAAPHYAEYMSEINRNMSPTRKRPTKMRPTSPLLQAKQNKDETHLSKVEELLEKDNEYVEVVTKQPLKSILNNPTPIPPLQGILKKPKNRNSVDSKLSEGRRRQRASSESDNLIFNGSNTNGYDCRTPYGNSNMKRAKDNFGSGYTYGNAIATFSTQIQKTNSPYKLNTCKSPKSNQVVLRTTAINNIVTEVDVPVSGSISPIPTCPPVSPSLPVSSVTNLPAKTVRTTRKKLKKNANMKDNHKLEPATGEDHLNTVSRSPSPDKCAERLEHMDTETIIRVQEHFEQISPAKVEQNNGTKISTKLTNGTIGNKKTNHSIKESTHSLPETLAHCLRPSLFPRVPPYIKFVGHEDVQTIKIPFAVQKHMIWKLTSITPIVVKKTITNSGFRLLKSECDTAECPQEETIDWIGIWGKHMKSLMFRGIKDGQKMNHFPGSFQIGRKDRLWRNLQKLSCKYGHKEFGIMPKSYVLPHDMKFLKQDWECHAAFNEKWIIKPPASARGTGIKVVSKWTQIPKKRRVVVQKYVSKPYLINGSKFDMRLYVLITSIHPLRIYLHNDGLARFASVKYNDELDSLHDRYMHLTNYSINRLSKNYTPNEDFSACEGHKWTLQTLFHYLKTEKKVDTDALWDSMKDLVVKTIISGESSVSSLTKANITSRYNCYELFGIDVLLDENLKPWLLEVNISPSLHSASPLDIHVKAPLVTDVLNLAQFHVPTKINIDSLSKDSPQKLNNIQYDSRLYTVYLSKEERDKHIIYNNMDDRDLYLRDILSTLTPDDVRHLIQSEDELTQVRNMERIFPTSKTHKYLTFMAGPRYYNRLFDAWETRYSHNRDAGIDLLTKLCEIGYHLEVPPVPLKRAAAELSALDGCRMTWMRRRRQLLRERAWNWSWSHSEGRPSGPRTTRTRTNPGLANRKLTRKHRATGLTNASAEVSHRSNTPATPTSSTTETDTLNGTSRLNGEAVGYC